MDEGHNAESRLWREKNKIPRAARKNDGVCGQSIKDIDEQLKTCHQMRLMVLIAPSPKLRRFSFAVGLRLQPAPTRSTTLAQAHTGLTDCERDKHRTASMAERLRGHKGVAQRRRRMLRSNWLCEHCQAKGITRKADVVDHIKPLAHGGPDTDENTRNLCHDCHLDAGAEQFGHRKKVRISLDGWPVDTDNTVRLA